MTDRKNDVSTALTEVRTVHSRALSALDKLNSLYAVDTWYDGVPWDGEGGNEGYWDWYAAHHITYADPDHDEIYEALQKVVELLAPWQGKRRRR